MNESGPSGSGGVICRGVRRDPRVVGETHDGRPDTSPGISRVLPTEDGSPHVLRPDRGDLDVVTRSEGELAQLGLQAPSRSRLGVRLLRRRLEEVDSGRAPVHDERAFLCDPERGDGSRQRLESSDRAIVFHAADYEASALHRREPAAAPRDPFGRRLIDLAQRQRQRLSGTHRQRLPVRDHGEPESALEVPREVDRNLHLEVRNVLRVLDEVRGPGEIPLSDHEPIRSAPVLRRLLHEREVFTLDLEGLDLLGQALEPADSSAHVAPERPVKAQDGHAVHVDLETPDAARDGARAGTRLPDEKRVVAAEDAGAGQRELIGADVRGDLAEWRVERSLLLEQPAVRREGCESPVEELEAPDPLGDDDPGRVRLRTDPHAQVAARVHVADPSPPFGTLSPVLFPLKVGVVRVCGRVRVRSRRHLRLGPPR